ncbi:hypothetical protein OQA88_995 [Cercophora sp. LCS_1]
MTDRDEDPDPTTLGPGNGQVHHRPSFHAPQHSLSGFSNASEETYREEDSYPDLFAFEKTRSITELTALTPNRAKFNCDDSHNDDNYHNHGHDDDDVPKGQISLKTRLAHFTWAWYTLVMSTGGLSLLIAAQPHTFPGLRGIGFALYILNLVFFVTVTCLMITRFALHRGTFIRSITHKREGFFLPTFFLSIATLVTSTQRYCVTETPPPGLLWFIQIAFWSYLVLTTLVAVGQYFFIFTTHQFALPTMMPTWILPIFPIMLSGTIASVIAGSQPPGQAVAIITAGLTCQGLGLSVSLMMYAHMVGRLMQTGLPDREHRPGLFMCVGPPSFTALSFLGLANALPADFDHDGDGFLDTSEIRTMAIIGAGFLWALSFWWFGIAFLSVAVKRPRFFHLGWWAGVFPNVGFVLATIQLGEAFSNEGVLWVRTSTHKPAPGWLPAERLPAQHPHDNFTADDSYEPGSELLGLISLTDMMAPEWWFSTKFRTSGVCHLFQGVGPDANNHTPEPNNISHVIEETSHSIGIFKYQIGHPDDDADRRFHLVVWVGSAHRSNDQQGARVAWAVSFGPNSHLNKSGYLSPSDPQTTARADIEALSQATTAVKELLFSQGGLGWASNLTRTPCDAEQKTRCLVKTECRGIHFYTDSDYLCQTMTTRMKRWMKNNGQGARHPVAHFDALKKVYCDLMYIENSLWRDEAMGAIYFIRIHPWKNTEVKALANKALDPLFPSTPSLPVQPRSRVQHEQPALDPRDYRLSPDGPYYVRRSRRAGQANGTEAAPPTAHAADDENAHIPDEVGDQEAPPPYSPATVP